MGYSTQLTQRIWLTEEVFELAFTRPDGLNFLPGQHICFNHDGEDRDYTPVSAGTDETIRICVKQVPDPNFSGRLATCPVGETFDISGPRGLFIHQPSDLTDVFVGTGTGVAPFAAYARSGVSGYMLLQGVRQPDQLIYGELLKKNSATYVPCLSSPSQNIPDQGFHGRVTDYLETRLPAGVYQFYLCGRREMILDATDIIDERFPDSRVFAERFT